MHGLIDWLAGWLAWSTVTLQTGWPTDPKKQTVGTGIFFITVADTEIPDPISATLLVQMFESASMSVNFVAIEIHSEAFFFYSFYNWII